MYFFGPFPADGCAQLQRNFSVKWRARLPRLLHVHIFLLSLGEQISWRFSFGTPWQKREGGGRTRCYQSLYLITTQKTHKKWVCAVSFERERLKFQRIKTERLFLHKKQQHPVVCQLSFAHCLLFPLSWIALFFLWGEMRSHSDHCSAGTRACPGLPT